MMFLEKTNENRNYLKFVKRFAYHAYDAYSRFPFPTVFNFSSAGSNLPFIYLKLNTFLPS